MTPPVIAPPAAPITVDFASPPRTWPITAPAAAPAATRAALPEPERARTRFTPDEVTRELTGYVRPSTRIDAMRISIPDPADVPVETTSARADAPPGMSVAFALTTGSVIVALKRSPATAVLAHTRCAASSSISEPAGITSHARPDAGDGVSTVADGVVVGMRASSVLDADVPDAPVRLNCVLPVRAAVARCELVAVLRAERRVDLAGVSDLVRAVSRAGRSADRVSRTAREAACDGAAACCPDSMDGISA